MRRIKLVLALGAAVALLLAVSAGPAMAQGFFVDFDDDDEFEEFFFNGRGFDGDFEQDFDQEAESGDVDLEFSTENTGDNSNVCAPALQFANTGNVQNEQGFTSIGGFDFDGDGFFDFFDGNGDVEFEAEDQFVFEPSLETTCEQSVEQAAAASSN